VKWTPVFGPANAISKVDWRRQERLRLLEIFVRHRRFEQADELLRQTIDQYPEDRLILARMKARTGNLSAAREEAELACHHLKQKVVAVPAEPSGRIQLAQAHVFLGQFPLAFQCLIEGLDQGDSEVLVDAACRTYEHWFSMLDPAQQSSQQLCMSRLLSSQSAANVSEIGTAAPHLAEFRKAMQGNNRKLLSQVMLGNCAAASGDLRFAEAQFRLALQVSPNDPSLQNNLAWVIGQKITQHNSSKSLALTASADTLAVDEEAARRIKLDMIEAISLSRNSVAAMPDVIEFRETFGQLLSLDGDHEEAVSEFRACLAKGYQSAAIHRTLSKCYLKLGNHAESQKHDELARRIP